MAVPTDRMNRRTATPAQIRRATGEAQARLRDLDARATADLRRIYEQAAADIEARIREAAGSGNLVREERLQHLRDQVQQRVAALSGERGDLLDQHLSEAAQQGTEPWSGAVEGNLQSIADDAVAFVRTFEASDGLQLSDRLWRLDRGANQAVRQVLENAVVQGHSASRAAADLVAQGEAVPESMQRTIDAARADTVAPRAADALLQGDRAPYENARRVFRTELGRAHNAAFEQAAFEHPDVIGTKFTLSPRHPRRDICDLHASANRYGLGPGVYPQGRNPYPAHPNTFSFIQPVFADEVSEDDRQNVEHPVDWLKRQPADLQAEVLGGQAKQRAFAQGLIGEGAINTPWRVIRQRLERQGIDVEALEVE